MKKLFKTSLKDTLVILIEYSNKGGFENQNVSVIEKRKDDHYSHPLKKHLISNNLISVYKSL